MEKSPEVHHQLTLSQQLHHAFFSPKGYDPFENLKSHDGDAIYESYLRCNKTIASGITLLNSQISFVSKFNKTL